ncbi:MAG: glycosyltransferase [bacterium]|nr:glycosyltransferase [bacterium]
MSDTRKLHLADLSSRLRRDWDERVEHDYRYWMSDGVSSDAEMWETGERDLSCLLTAIPQSGIANFTSLEIGCGVGRIVRAASRRFRLAKGIDVSPAAIERGRILLQGFENVELLLGDGFTFAPIENSSIDFVYTFAALSSMPVAVTASYIAEMARVVRPAGYAALQLFIGNPSKTVEEDTLAIRTFSRENFEKALNRAGFTVIAASELKLPFEISDRDAGSIAEIVTLRNSPQALTKGQLSGLYEDVLAILCGDLHESPQDDWAGSQTAYYMALARVQQHLDVGDRAEALRALELAVRNYSEPEAEVLVLLRRIKDDLAQSNSTLETGFEEFTWERAPVSFRWAKELAGNAFNENYFRQNLRVLKQRFPGVYQTICQLASPAEHKLELARASSGDPVIVSAGIPLDNMAKPHSSAARWVEQVMRDFEKKELDRVIVAGFATGYHLDELRQKMPKIAVEVYEPLAATILLACAVGNMVPVLQYIEKLHLRGNWQGELEAFCYQAQKIELLIHPQTKAAHGRKVRDLCRSFWSERGIAELRPSIGVVGPIYGGTLPMARYTASALESLGQKVRLFDLETFYPVYKKFEEMLRTPQRQSSLQGHYVELLSQLLLEAIAERPVDILICLAQAPLSARALTALRERGVITVLWFVEDGKRFETWKHISRYYDYVFVIQEDGFPEQVEAAGAGSAIYLPSACDPSIHKPLQVTEEERLRWGSDVSFVGAGYNNRQHMFATLTKFDFKIWGTEWAVAPPFDRFVQEFGRRISPEDYVKIFNSTKINLNLHSSSERDGVEPNGDFINPRTFELAACGAFQLVDRRTLLPALFDMENELATFSDRAELHHKIEYYLEYPEEREPYVSRARERVLAEHTYEHRMRAMLGAIYADRYRELQDKMSGSPWASMIRAASGKDDLQKIIIKSQESGGEPTLETLMGKIQAGKGNLSDTEKKLLFLDQIGKQIGYVLTKRSGG